MNGHRLVACAAFCAREKEAIPYRLVARFQPNLHAEKQKSDVWLLKSQFYVIITIQIGRDYHAIACYIRSDTTQKNKILTITTMRKVMM
jgi:hypothetical protein